VNGRFLPAMIASGCCAIVRSLFISSVALGAIFIKRLVHPDDAHSRAPRPPFNRVAKPPTA
jgi:hypothetical protein